MSADDPSSIAPSDGGTRVTHPSSSAPSLDPEDEDNTEPAPPKPWIRKGGWKWMKAYSHYRSAWALEGVALWTVDVPVQKGPNTFNMELQALFHNTSLESWKPYIAEEHTLKGGMKVTIWYHGW
jgi:hypothetical protein